MTDFAKSGRRDTFKAYLVDPFSLEEIEEVAIVPSECSLTYGFYTDNKYSGNITFAGAYTHERDYLIRIKQHTEVDDMVYDRVIATMFVEDIPHEALFGLETYSAGCYSTLYRLTQDKLMATYQRIGPRKNKGTLGAYVYYTIEKLVTDRGGKIVFSPEVDTNLRHTKDCRWDIGEDVIDIINQVTGGAGWEVTVDGYGYINVHNYIKPENRPVKFDFVDVVNCLYKSGANLSQTAMLCNVAVAYYTSGDKSDSCPPQYLPATSRHSFQRTGRYRPGFVQLNESCSKKTLVNKAQAYLAENSGEIVYIEIEHVGIPDLTIGDVVTYENNSDFEEPFKRRCMITEMSISNLESGCMTKTKMKVVDGTVGW